MEVKKKNIYQIIEDDIKNSIKDGKLKNGDRIPSENELKDKYNVSRMTVRQAINNLVNQGLIYRHKGKGTFVCNMKIEKNIFGMQGFTEYMELNNKKVTNKVLSFELIKPEKKIYENLSLNENEFVYCIKRIRYANDIPILFEIMYLPYDLFKNLDINVFNNSFYNFIEKKLNLHIYYATQKIEAILAGKFKSEILEIKETDPLLYVKNISFLDSGRSVEYVESFYRADQYCFIQRSFR